MYVIKSKKNNIHISKNILICKIISSESIIYAHHFFFDQISQLIKIIFLLPSLKSFVEPPALFPFKSSHPNVVCTNQMFVIVEIVVEIRNRISFVVEIHIRISIVLVVVEIHYRISIVCTNQMLYAPSHLPGFSSPPKYSFQFLSSFKSL